MDEEKINTVSAEQGMQFYYTEQPPCDISKRGAPIYCRPLEDVDVPEIVSYQKIDRIFEAHFTRTTDNYHVDRLITVVDFARVCFGPGMWFWDVCLTNPYLTCNNRQFVGDCMKYIIHGRRQMSIQGRLDMMHYIDKEDPEHPMKKMSGNVWSKDPILQAYGPLRQFISHHPQNLHWLSIWIAHDQGLEDLIQTLQILFGKTVNPHERSYGRWVN